MSERVFTNKQNIVEIVYDGRHDIKKSNKVIAQLKIELAKLEKMNKPKKVLLDLTKLGQTDRRSRGNVIDVAKNWDYHRIAVYGANVFNKVLAELIIFASGKKNKIKIFSSREEALKWLNQ